MESTSTETCVRRELFRLAFHNSAQSVVMQIAAILVMATFGFSHGRAVAAGVVLALGVAVASWRLAISMRYTRAKTLSNTALHRVQLEFECNAAVSGLMWATATLAIYPGLPGTMATTYVGMVFGSITVAAFFMTLVGRSFFILTGIQLGALICVSLVDEQVRSVPVAVLALIFGLTVYRASGEFKGATTRAIRHSQEANEANALLQKAKDSAESANLSKSQFLATMSHEIRTPMNGVLGALDMLRGSPLNLEQRRLVRMAASSGESLMSILNDVLDHSKIEAGKLVLMNQAFSLHVLVVSVVSLFRSNAQNKGLKLQLELNPQLEDWVIGDAQRLKQVLMNLVGNAIKFTEQGSVVLRLEPSRKSFPADSMSVTFQVQDTGIGIEPEAQAVLFQPFYQVDGTRNRLRGGTGLGLTISQRIVEAMGGQVAVFSRVGQGSCFEFTLNLALDFSAKHPTFLDSTTLDAQLTQSPLQGTVLVVEDNEVNRMIARAALEFLGLYVLEAENGLQALEKIEAYSVDLVLMDCQMPVMDGYEATQKIRQRESKNGLRRLPVVALTADAFQEDAQRSHESGMDAHLSKPYTRQQLQILLRQWL
jgi:two-component system, sensor histidine kinase